MTYGSPTLRFTHRTARVTIVLTDNTEGLASVQLTGLSTEGGNPDIIVPYDKGSNTYTAIVAPQSVAAGTAFITCTFTDGKTFVYKMKNATDWQAGGEYTYTVSLATARGYIIEDDGSYTVYNADGLMNIAELVNGGRHRAVFNGAPARSYHATNTAAIYLIACYLYALHHHVLHRTSSIEPAEQTRKFVICRKGQPRNGMAATIEGAFV